jgi:hypothetical protein
VCVRPNPLTLCSFARQKVPSSSSPKLIEYYAEGTAWRAASFVVMQALPDPAPARGLLHSARGGGRNGARGRGGGRGGIQEREGFAGFVLEEAAEGAPAVIGRARSRSRSRSLQRLPSGPIARKAAPEMPAKKRRADPNAVVGHRVSDDDDDEDEYDGTEQRARVNTISMEASVATSQAGKLVYGAEVQERVSVTGNEYAYDHASDTTVLSLSICPGIELNQVSDLDALAKAGLKEALGAADARLLNGLKAVFKEEFCVIDLESPADTIIAQCGHQCVNHSNTKGLKECPVCRGHITALIRAAGPIVA